MKTDKLKEILSQSALDELFEDFYEEYFGGLFEDLYFDGLNFLFPQVSPKDIAIIEIDLSSAEIDKAKANKLLEALLLPDIDRIEEKLQSDKLDFDKVTKKNACYLIEFPEMIIRLNQNKNKALASIEIFDVNLIAENSADFSKNEILELF